MSTLSFNTPTRQLLPSEMAVMNKKMNFNSFREFGVIAENSQGRTFYQHHNRPAYTEHLTLQLSPTSDGGKQTMFHADDYLVHDDRAVAVEVRDAQVPDLPAEGANILNLSHSLAPTLDTPSIIAEYVDQEPFRFGQDMSPSSNAILVIGDNETFQDLSELIINDTTLSQQPAVSQSPEPLLSPSSSYSNMSSPCPSSAMSHTDQEAHFFPELDLLTFKEEQDLPRSSGGRPRRGPNNHYSEMRRKNNLASKRSRISRREKEREMETQQKELEEENKMLKIKVQRLEEGVLHIKDILFRAVAGRSLPRSQ